jgi:hypothetical protein
MRTTILIVLLGIIVAAGVFWLKTKTRIDWSKMQAIEVYTDSTLGKDFEKMEDVDLKNKAHYSLDREQARKLFEKAKTEVQIVTIWKEYRYAVVYFSGQKPLRLKVSNNDGFFLVLNYGRKFQISDEYLEEWNALWKSQ